MTEPVLLCVDNVAVEAGRRALYRAIAAIGPYEVHLLVPATWQEQGGVVTAEPEHDPRLHLHVSPIVFGHRQHRVIYRALPHVLEKVRPALLFLDTEPENYAALQARYAIRRASPDTRLALVSSRNMDYPALGFPYKAAFTHAWCDTYFLKHPVDLLYVRPAEGMPLLRGYARHLHRLPHVIDCSVFTPGGASMVPRHGFTVGYLGRLVPEKGVDVLLHACARLDDGARVIIAGKGPARPDLERLAVELGVRERVTFLDPIPYARVPSFLRSLDVLALPSRPSPVWVEQFGRVLIEAMACGIPVVASESGEIPAVLGTGGVLVPPGDARALGNELHILMSSPERCRQIGDAGRARALATFDATAVASWFLETLQPLGPPFLPAAT